MGKVSLHLWFVVAEDLNSKADKSKSGFVKTTELAD